ncbi:hypothetical protein LINPERHAP2_LOCUS5768 [Linum perenne]
MDDMGMRRVIFQSDAKQVVDVINNKTDLRTELGNLTRSCNAVFTHTLARHVPIVSPLLLSPQPIPNPHRAPCAVTSSSASSTPSLLFFYTVSLPPAPSFNSPLFRLKWKDSALNWLLPFLSIIPGDVDFLFLVPWQVDLVVDYELGIAIPCVVIGGSHSHVMVPVQNSGYHARDDLKSEEQQPS